ncbi:C40 family peptidase [Aureibacter tunicatorum]|uniref:Uncharacterized protein (TIGR02594 family) n=1 Tax=Aureibacter tunicatorum TaxID=866807 RepID=A0AAE3XN67_9BACT|nr:TIGR02594 family protein [Aureibacter tunicatorum]MDR6241011.1 uncharacterized protein (TIGR02594 family) [Aureibacter tunicatorum]BDD03789.1 hypothetical protein AUTU_12720 [Aureibacter tunicatorum]
MTEYLLKLAFEELGEKEIPGPLHNERVVQYAQDSGFEWINDDETPWCSVFVNWLAIKSGMQSSGSAMARSWLNVGLPVDRNPLPGDVVVFWRVRPNASTGHVGLFLGYSEDGRKIYCLGGNQKNSVSVEAYPVERLLGFRRLLPVGQLPLPDVVLRKGDQGMEVKLLQEFLKSIGYNCGVTDGKFGPITEKALVSFQVHNGLEEDGVYNEEVRNIMKNIHEEEALEY